MTREHVAWTFCAALGSGIIAIQTIALGAISAGQHDQLELTGRIMDRVVRNSDTTAKLLNGMDRRLSRLEAFHEEELEKR